MLSHLNATYDPAAYWIQTQCMNYVQQSNTVM